MLCSGKYGVKAHSIFLYIKISTKSLLHRNDISQCHIYNKYVYVYVKSMIGD